MRSICYFHLGWPCAYFWRCASMRIAVGPCCLPGEAAARCLLLPFKRETLTPKFFLLLTPTLPYKHQLKGFRLSILTSGGQSRFGSTSLEPHWTGDCCQGALERRVRVSGCHEMTCGRISGELPVLSPWLWPTTTAGGTVLLGGREAMGSSGCCIAWSSHK